MRNNKIIITAFILSVGNFLIVLSEFSRFSTLAGIYATTPTEILGGSLAEIANWVLLVSSFILPVIIGIYYLQMRNRREYRSYRPYK